MSLSLALILGAVQGFTELFPLSSLGILVLLPHVFPVPYNLNGAQYLPFVVAVHVGTALALLLYFLGDWIQLIRGGIRSLSGHANPEGTLLGRLIIATIPAGLVGFLLKHPLARLFDAPLLAAIFLVVNAGLLFLADRWHRLRRRPLTIEKMSARQSLVVGLFQMFALIPGLSRSGLSMAGGLRQGLDFKMAARFAFLMATPIIGAAGILELPKLVHHQAGGPHLLGPALVGGIVAGLVAWGSTHFLMRYFEHGNLRAFGLLSLAMGVAGLLIIH